MKSLILKLEVSYPPGAGGGGGLCQGVANTFKNFFSTLGDGSDF